MRKMASLRTYILTRIFLTIPMIFLLLSMVFLLLHVIPGDPVSAMLGPRAPPEYLEQMRERLGLNKPLHEQYFDYLFNILRGDFGTSMYTDRPVVSELLEKFPATFELTLSSMVVAVIVGIFTGAFAANHHNRIGDHFFRLYSIGVFAIPIFWLGLMLQLIFGIFLKWLPTSHRISAGAEFERITGIYFVDSILNLNPNAFFDVVIHLILPSITLGFVLSGVICRMMRINMLETLKQDYIVAGRARGLHERTVVYSYALKNALIPVVTVMGLQFALLLSGAILTETVFSWPGVGRYLYLRIGYRDYPAVQGAIVFFAFFVSLVSLIVDIIYAYLDPRIRY